MDCSPPASSVQGTFQARVLEWVTTSYSRGSSQLRNWTCISVSLVSSALAGGFFTTEPQWEAHLLLKSERVRHSFMSDSATPWTIVHQAPLSMELILQDGTLEWVAIYYSRGSSWPRDWTHVSYISCIAGRFFTIWATREDSMFFLSQNTTQFEIVVYLPCVVDTHWIVSHDSCLVTSLHFHLHVCSSHCRFMLLSLANREFVQW